MTYYTLSSGNAAGLVTALNAQAPTSNNVVAIVHDGTNFVAFYWK